ncbi:endolytic transglycosylase MltG [Nocardioides sp.]|uniref:endolytic transglycosylase MltG n=1 Tax=Nocardioides sp. TaxID=35761 RepID=UPI00260B5320|nr:endolytic transglycosylase MltG [Nocardioides sp.]
MTETPPTPGEGTAFVPGLDDTAERPAVRRDDVPPAPLAPQTAEAPSSAGTPTAAGGRRRAEKSRLPGLLAVVIALVVIVGGGWFAWGKVTSLVDKISGSGSSDYSGTAAHGDVTFEVHAGDSATAIGRNLKAAGVVASVDSFISAANANPDAAGIQVGFYSMKQEMSAADALAVLLNPANMVSVKVTIPEGKRLADIVTILAKKTSFSKADFTTALKNPAKLGLPSYADGNAEGYLFPATYAFGPKETPTEMLTAMIAKTVSVLDSLDVATQAKKVNLSVEQVMTVASILEYEASRTEDYPKVARAIYNRLNQGMRLQSDATVAYANGLSGDVWTTTAQRSVDSPYNTYVHTGLPPGPIGSPGETTIKAALNPAQGSWLYWVVVNLKTGETVFSTTLAEHNAATQKLREYCKTSDAC